MLQLQSASAASQSQAVDYQSGIEAMVLAILQQSNVSQQAELAAASNLTMPNAQSYWVLEGARLKAYNTYLDDALAANSNLTNKIETALLNSSQSASVLPVSRYVTTKYKIMMYVASCIGKLLQSSALSFTTAADKLGKSCHFC